MIFDNIKVGAESVVDAQTRFEELWFDAKETSLENSPFSTQEEHDAHVCELREKLNPVAVNLLKLPPVFLVRIKSELFDDHGLVGTGLSKNAVYILLGEIAQMPDHCVIMDIRTKAIFPMMHTHNLELVPPNEA